MITEDNIEQKEKEMIALMEQTLKKRRILLDLQEEVLLLMEEVGENVKALKESFRRGVQPSPRLLNKMDEFANSSGEMCSELERCIVRPKFDGDIRHKH